jgi:hypothetical protein
MAARTAKKNPMATKALRNGISIFILFKLKSSLNSGSLLFTLKLL